MKISVEINVSRFHSTNTVRMIETPKKLLEKFKEIDVQYTWFREQLKEALRILRGTPIVGCHERKNGMDCYGFPIAHYMLYYIFDENHVKLIDIERIFYTW